MRIDIYGTSVEFTQEGSGEPVILLHSSGSSGAQWRSLAECLSARYQVIAPDLYGYGRTADWGGRGIFCLAHEAALLRGLMERLDEPAHLVGHSYGGALAMHLARTGTELRSLALIEPVAFHLLRGERDAAAFREISGVAESVVGAIGCGDYAAGFGRFVDYWSGAGAWASMPAAKRDALVPRLAKVALDFHATLNEPARLEDFARLAVPMLIVQGGRTAAPTRRICERLACAVPGAKLEIVDGAGHMAPMTHRDAVNDLIVAHLDANAVLPGRTSCKTRREPIATQSA